MEMEDRTKASHIETPYIQFHIVCMYYMSWV
jgi:hypothetical protein